MFFALPLIPVLLIAVAVWAIRLSRGAPGPRTPAALPGA